MCHDQRHSDCEPDRAELIARARVQAATMTAADRARQRVDFVWASLNLEPDDPAVSREFVEQVDHQLFGTPAGDGHA